MKTQLVIDKKTSVLKGNLAPVAAKLALGLEGRKTWLSPNQLRFETSKANIDLVMSLLPTGMVEDKRSRPDEAKLFDLGESAPLASPEPKFRLEPFDFQRENFERFKDQPVWAIFSVQGCVDRDTEYLSPSGWRKISEYDGGMVAQYNLDDGSASFVQPDEYHVKPCKEMVHFKTKYGCDQMLSKDHRILLQSRVDGIRRKLPHQYWRDDVKRDENWQFFETTPERLMQRFEKKFARGGRVPGFIPTHFVMDGEGIDIGEFDLRLQVAFIADGTFGSKAMVSSPSGKRHGYIRIKKQRKKERLEWILARSSVEWSKKDVAGGFSIYKFVPPINEKHFVSEFWWKASAEQKRIISEECLHWDGSRGAFCSHDERDADFIQFCFSSTGRRSRLSKRGKTMYVGMSNEPVALGVPKVVPSPDGKMYCFTVPSSYLVFRRNGCVFVSGNSGKTKVAFDIICHRYLKGTVTGVIILSSPKGVHAQWINEQMPKHLWEGIEVQAMIWEGKKPPLWFGQPSSKLQIISGNIDMLKGKGHALLEQFACQHRQRLMILVDESDSIKNLNSVRSKKLRKLAEVTRQRAIMSGTPIAKDLTDEFAQFYFLDPDIIGHKYLTSFRAQYCIMDGFENRYVVGHKNLEQFKRLTAPYIFRATKEDLNLPPKVYDEVVFDLTDEQRRLIKEIRESFYASLESGEATSVSNGAVALLRIQQISNGFVAVDEGPVRFIDNPRMDALKQLRKDISGPVVIWCRFKADVELLKQEFGASAATYYGETSPADRVAAKEAFIRGDVRELIATPGAAGRGIDGLQKVCSDAIYYSNSFNAIDRWQSEDRTDRIGGKGTASYFDLIGRGSADRGILRNLRRKKNISDLALEELKEIMDEVA